MNQNLRREMQNYPNERIINTISQPQYFSKTSVKIAQEIAVERNLLSQPQINSLHQQANSSTAAPISRSSSTAYQHRATDNDGPSVVGIIFGILIIIKFLVMLARFN